MKNRVPMAVCNSFTSVFADPGENMSLKPNAVRERTETTTMIPRWVKLLKPDWIVHHRLRWLVAGHFSLKPANYSTFIRCKVRNSGSRLTCPSPRRIWWNRL
jgi:hypothetical protein